MKSMRSSPGKDGSSPFGPCLLGFPGFEGCLLASPLLEIFPVPSHIDPLLFPGTTLPLLFNLRLFLMSLRCLSSFLFFFLSSQSCSFLSLPRLFLGSLAGKLFVMSCCLLFNAFALGSFFPALPVRLLKFLDQEGLPLFVPSFLLDIVVRLGRGLRDTPPIK